MERCSPTSRRGFGKVGFDSAIQGIFDNSSVSRPHALKFFLIPRTNIH